MKKWISRILLLVWMIIIFIYSAQEGGNSSKKSDRISVALYNAADTICDFGHSSEQKADIISNMSTPVRKTAHMAEYAIMLLLAYFSFSKYLLSYIMVVIYASSDEIHQYFVPGRACRFTDVLIDSAGALLMLGLIYLISSRKRKR